MMKDGPDGAREALATFWRAISDSARFSPIQRSPIDVFMGNWSLDNSPSYLFLDLFSRVASPYDLNPLDIHPLRDLVESHVDWDRVHTCDRIKLFISATNVRSGRIKVFQRHELTVDMVMASACLPLLFKTVEIDGEGYWDGGYMGNPALFPLIYECEGRDIVIVQINPIKRSEIPRSARGILNRLNEITFNSRLLRELRALNFVSRLLDEGSLDATRYKRMLIHRIDAEEELRPLGSSSKMNAEWAFLKHLHDIGQRATESWLDANAHLLGKASSVDLRALFT
jgi:NTE family protein